MTLQQEPHGAAAPTTPGNARWLARAAAASTAPATWDLGACLLWVGWTTLALALSAPVWLRVVLGVPFIFVVPGYALTGALFPTDEAIDGVERLALAGALSLATLPLVALGIQQSPWALTLWPLVLGLDGATVLFAGVALVRRARADAAERFVPRLPRLALPPPRRWTRTTRLAVGLLLVSLLLLGTAGGLLLAARFQGEPTTEFGLFNADGKPAFYPRAVAPGAPATVQLAVTNAEGHATHYRLVVTANGQVLTRIPDIAVARGTTWQQRVTLVVPPADQPVPVLFALYRADQPATARPYRLLRLVVAAGTPTPTGP